MHSLYHWIYSDKVIIGSSSVAQKYYGTTKAVDAAVLVAEKYEQHTDLPIWTCDYHGKSGKKFYVIHGIEEFFIDYLALSEHERMYYELVRPNRLCKLYFDVEFARHNDETRSKSMDEVTAHILAQVRLRLVRDYGVSQSEDVTMVEMDSSTDTKASRHLIFNIHQVAFESVKDVKCFVHMTFPGLQNVESTSENAVLLWRNDKGETCHCIDGSVYSINRSFRLWMSHKGGKPNVFHFMDKRALNPADFVKSLITTFPREMHLEDVRRLRFDLPMPSFRRKRQASSRPDNSIETEKRARNADPEVLEQVRGQMYRALERFYNTVKR